MLPSTSLVSEEPDLESLGIRELNMPKTFSRRSFFLTLVSVASVRPGRHTFSATWCTDCSRLLWGEESLTTEITMGTND